MARIHGIGVDVMAVKRYSVPILGKYLVTIANPAKYLMHAQFPVSSSLFRLLSAPNPIITSVLADLTGGYFTA